MDKIEFSCQKCLKIWKSNNLRRRISGETRSKFSIYRARQYCQNWKKVWLFWSISSKLGNANFNFKEFLNQKLYFASVCMLPPHSSLSGLMYTFLKYTEMRFLTKHKLWYDQPQSDFLYVSYHYWKLDKNEWCGVSILSMRWCLGESVIG